MKKRFILPILLCFFFANCEKVIDVDVPSIAPKLVIDATFEVLFDENPVTANTVVKLSLSADYFNDEIPTVTNANVFLTNLSDNSIIPFSDANADGNYEPTNAFIPADDTAYELTVIYENETYKAQATKIKSTPFVSVVQGDETLFTGDEIQLKIEFQDDETLENYYLLDYTNNIFLALDDRFFNGSLYNFSSFYQEDDIEVPTTVTIKMHGITKEYFTYFEVLISQSGQNSGGPFESAPASLLGNIINTTNDDYFPLGYFHISETDTYTIDLVENE
ncbi:hypothetical protein BW723_10715 [Polaribacter reichenbachii]|uniref:DUF4249 domain-containing protein n=1 Tax=Polaribacter reichenbachii TaxID=996801 RepID=A0A1B8TQ33_9FLAO|nr:DUF4249 family protein [Polaribacter reichenbachii]APZ46725.1 hypothetical protein BW723_10715 [Polaribacter reichenbachii]AUC17368.1 hypothetical protein BTO17_01160 [Polaribacter reichenbachii]OBY61756.1 hypothetical protein LPB301_17040 [Polaribacter reichenbachii]